MIYAGSIGVTFAVSTGVDLTNYASLELEIKKPGGTSVTWIATAGSPLTGGTMTYTSADGDLDDAGTYLLQSHVTMLDGSEYWGETTEFEVYSQFVSED